MRRLLVRGSWILVVLLLTIAAVTPLGWRQVGNAASQQSYPSGGVGLSQTEWEVVHGAPMVGQSHNLYEDGRYAVWLQDEAVFKVEFGWDDAVEQESATAEVETYLPQDAILTEDFYAPPTGDGPIALRVHRYESDSIASQFPRTTPAATGSISVIYQEDNRNPYEPLVTRATLIVGTEPN